MASNATSLIKDYISTFALGVITTNTPTVLPAFPYAATEYLALSEYATSTAMFENVNVGDCGVFTTCYVKPVGCTGTYTGRARVTASAPFGLEVV